MALLKNIDLLDNGIPLGYWAITHYHVDHLAGAVSIWLHGWRDESARLAGRAPACPLALTLTRDDLDDLHDLNTGSLYAALKSKAIAGPDGPTLLPNGAACFHALLAQAQDC